MKHTLRLLTVLLLAPLAAAQAVQFHVATTGDDANQGTKSAPWRTIQHAADLAQPGDTITVHAGTYRQRINPPRGGTSDAKRIVYQAAQGEQVEIKGSEVVNHWGQVQENVWKVTLPNSFFGRFNPYRDLIRGDWFADNKREHHTGAVYLKGEWLTEAAKLDEVLMSGSPAWITKAERTAGLNPQLWFAQVDETNTTIWAQFKGVNPNEQLVEINVRQTIFYPDQPGRNYITVRGFTLRHAATPWAPPTAEQIGLIGTPLEQGLADRKQRGQPLDLLGHCPGQARRRIRQHFGQFRRGLRQDHRARSSPRHRLDPGEHRAPRRPQQYGFALRAGRDRRESGRGLQHRHRQYHPRHPYPAVVLRRGDGRHQVSCRD